MINKEKNSTVKIAFWYTFASFFTKGLGVISTPIFARLLTTEEYGAFSNFSTWVSFLAILVTLDLHQSVMRAKYDYSKRMDQFITTILITSNVATLLFWLFVELKIDFFSMLLSMNAFYIRVMFVYILLEPAFTFLQIKHRMFQEYKTFVAYSLLASLIRVVVSILLVCWMTDKFAARVYGSYIPAMLLFVYLYISIVRKSNTFSWECCKYALIISVPMLPSTLGTNILSASDRVMIAHYSSMEEVALYTLVYQIAALFAVLWTSVNQAWTPWMFDALHAGHENIIKQKGKLYVVFFAFMLIGLSLIGPEILLLMGGNKYLVAINAFPPVVVGLFFQVIYALYVNIELYNKRTFQVSFCTFVAAGANVVLNLIFIPKYGYVAAAYTTLVGYVSMAGLHYYYVKKRLKMGYIFDNRFNLIISVLGVFLVIPLMSFLYAESELRYSIIIVYGLIFLFVLFKNRKNIQRKLIK